MGKLMSVKTIAAETGTSQSYWRKLISRRVIPVIKLGRSCRVREEDLVLFLRARSREARDDAR